MKRKSIKRERKRVSNKRGKKSNEREKKIKRESLLERKRIKREVSRSEDGVIGTYSSFIGSLENVTSEW